MNNGNNIQEFKLETCVECRSLNVVIQSDHCTTYINCGCLSYVVA